MIRVAVYKDVGSGPSSDKLISALDECQDIEWKKVMVEDITEEGLAGFDVLIHPGGGARKQAEGLGEERREHVRNFVKNGGGFVGFCAGAYLASSDYEWSLHILNSQVIDKKHWARGTGMVDVKLTDKGRALFGDEVEKLTIHYGQGPLLGQQSDLPDFDVLAVYDGEIAKKGAPKGVMKGTTAFGSGNFGKGRVFCFSPHPEMTDGLGWVVHRAVCWAGE